MIITCSPFPCHYWSDSLGPLYHLILPPTAFLVFLSASTRAGIVGAGPYCLRFNQHPCRQLLVLIADEGAVIPDIQVERLVLLVSDIDCLCERHGSDGEADFRRRTVNPVITLVNGCESEQDTICYTRREKTMKIDARTMEWTRAPKKYSVTADCVKITTEPHTDLWQSRDQK